MKKIIGIIVLLAVIGLGCDQSKTEDKPLTLCQQHCLDESQCFHFSGWRTTHCYQCRALCRIEGLMVLNEMEKQSR